MRIRNYKAALSTERQNEEQPKIYSTEGPVGWNTLGNTMKRMCEEAGIGYFTITILYVLKQLLAD